MLKFIEEFYYSNLDPQARSTKQNETVRYYVASRMFELPELKLLVDAVQSSKFITHKKSSELIKKIESFASRYQAQQLQRQVFVANRVKTMNESIYYAVDHIHEAINNNVKISFQYFRWNEKKEKVLRHNGVRITVSPWALTWDDENYYMIAYDHIGGIVKHYRVDKMLRIQLTDEKRDGATLFSDFDMALYSKATFGMFGGEEEIVNLRCSHSIAGVIIDRFGAELTFYNVTDTHFEIRIRVHTSPIFYAWLTSFGADITVLSPQRVIDEYVALARVGLDQYK